MHGSVTFLTTPTTIIYTEAIAQVDGVGCDHVISQHSKILVLICAIIGDSVSSVKVRIATASSLDLTSSGSSTSILAFSSVLIVSRWHRRIGSLGRPM